MMNLANALAQFRGERKQVQVQLDKLDAVIRGIEDLVGRNSSGAAHDGTQPKRPVSAASRRKMAQAQKARWAKLKQSQPAPAVKKTSTARVKRTMSAAARRKIGAAVRARWAKIKAQQKKAA